MLPERIWTLGADLQTMGSLTRLDSEGSVGGKKLAEADYDRLIVQHAGAVADALRAAGFLDESSVLKYLGGGQRDRQVLSIDVLFAEVDPGPDADFRRLVIVEDKLIRNSDRRTVLAQALDYASTLSSIDFDEFRQQLPDTLEAWLTGNDAALERCLRDGDFLLVICGDRIERRLIRTLEFLTSRSGLRVGLLGLDVALLAMAIYTDGQQHVLVPHVVGALAEAERKLQLKVTVQDARAQPIAAQVTSSQEVEDTRRKSRRERIELGDLLADIRGKSGEVACKTAECLLEFAESLDAEVVTKGASASVRMESPGSAQPSTIFVVTRKGTFFIGWLDRWARNSGLGPEVAREYEDGLSQILGANVVMRGTGGVNAIPLSAIHQHLGDVKRVIARAIDRLKRRA